MKSSLLFTNKRGLSPAIVIIVMVALGFVVESVLRLSIGTSHNQQDEYVWLDARNAAASAIECGFAELTKRFGDDISLPSNALSPTQSPLRLPSSYFSTFGQKTGAWIGSRIVLPNQGTYNPSSAAQWNTHPTQVIGGIVEPGVWQFIDGDSPGNEYDPLKNKMVFTRNINVYGKATATDFRNKRDIVVYARETLLVRDAPLFANAIFYNMDMEIAPGASMTVTGPVHSNYNSYLSSDQGLAFTGQFTTAGDIFHGVKDGFGKTASGGDVNFANASGTQVSMYKSGSWLDSNNTNFHQLASQRWGGNVQDSNFDIPTQNPVAISDYCSDDPLTTVDDDALNYAYPLIQPVCATTDTNYTHSIEQQKFSYKAGLTVVIDTSTSTPSYSLKTYARDGEGDIVYDVSGNPTTTALTYTGSNNFVSIAKSAKDKYGNVTSGIYDGRRAAYLSLVKIDMAKLKTAVETGSGGTSTDWNNDTTKTPNNWWNGIVYVEFSDSTPRTRDGVQVALDGWGVELINGGNLPNPAYAQANGIHGTTVATNNALYIQGNYNSDGDMATGLDGTADSNEVPAAVVADAITILSNNWIDTNSSKAVSYRNASSTEVSAAFLTGIVPSDKVNNNAYSGGVENFPRFLENWGGDTFLYRGSMVSLFESEVANDPWCSSSSVYSPPNRKWSFSDLFSEGNYPPGTPNSRTYRRVGYKVLTKSAYDQEMLALKAQYGL